MNLVASMMRRIVASLLLLIATLTSCTHFTAADNGVRSLHSIKGSPIRERLVAYDRRRASSPHNKQREQPSFKKYSYTDQSAAVRKPVLNPLFKQAGTASICLLFGLLIWRTLAVYEIADTFESRTLRSLTVIPTMLLLGGNIAGLGLNIMKPLNFKNHLKAILALNIVREVVELIYNVAQLILVGAATKLPREVYIGRLLMNLWWGTMCFSLARSRWVVQPTIPQSYREQWEKFQGMEKQ